MATAIETAFYALSHWLKEQGIEPADITLVIRSKDEMTRCRLNAALMRWQEGMTLYQTSNETTVKTSPFQYCGIKVNVSSLNASR